MFNEIILSYLITFIRYLSGIEVRTSNSYNVYLIQYFSLLRMLKKLDYNKVVFRSRNRTRADNKTAKKKKGKRQNATQKTKDWATMTPHKTMGVFRCSGRVTSRYSTIVTRQVILIFKIQMISHYRGEDRDTIVGITNGAYLL